MTMLPRVRDLRTLFCLSGLLLAVSVAAGGLQGEYFPEKRFTGTPENRVDATVNFGFGALPPGIDIDDLSVRWMGDLIAPTTGNYQFFTASDDGSRLFINGVLVVKDNWRDGGEQERPVTATLIPMTAGQRYPILMEFYQGNGGAVARLRWIPPGGVKEIIPEANLAPRPTAVQPGGTLIANAAVAMPATVNLTAVGSLDWIHWGQGGVTGRNRRNGSTVRISDYGQLGPVSEAVAVSTSTTSFTWTNGATTGDVANAVATTAGTTGAIQQGNIEGDGFGFIAPASTTERRRVLVYVGAGASPVSVTALLSDFSAAPITQTLPANTQRVFSYDYLVANANQNLIVRATTTTDGGPGRLIAAAVQAYPTATNQNLTTNEDVNLPIVLTGTDPEGQALTFTITTPPTNGTFMPNTPPNVTYVPNPNFNGTDSFGFTVTDPTGLTSSGTVNITIAPQDDPAGLVLVNDTATTPDNIPITVDVTANDTIIDRPFTLTLVGQPANGTAVINPNNTITYTGNLSFIGTDVVTYRVTDIDGSTATATLTVTIPPIPPTITAPQSVTAIQGLLFTYKITTTGTLPMVYTASPLPPGTTLVGDTISGFIPVGSYLVTLTATNQAATDTKQLVITSILLAPNADTDGDGYPDELEIGVGSSPVDPNSTPFTVLRNGSGALPPGTPPLGIPKPFALTGLSIKLNFKSTAPKRDSISVRGTLPVLATFSSQLQAVAINVGGVTLKGVLDSRGSFTSADKSVKIKVGKTKSTLNNANVPFSVSAKGLYSPTLVDEGYADKAAVKEVGSVRVLVLVGLEYFGVTANTEYSASQGRSGSVKPTKLR